jgi:peptidoglycan DL-endopeptidase LytE
MKGKCRIAIIFAAVAAMMGTLCAYSKEISHPHKAQFKNKRTEKPILKDNLAGSYKVRPGDNLLRISSKFGVTVGALKSTNKLKSNVIQVGQELKIPSTGKKAAQIIEAKKSPARLKPESLTPPPMAEMTAAPSESSESQQIRLQLAQAGFQFLGVRYHRSGESEKSGFDCSGLVKTLFSKFHIELPRTSRELYKQGEKVDRDKLEIGDLVFFSSKGSNPTHVGIYVGDNKFLHAALKAKQVIISDLNKIWYSMRYLGARRVIWGDDPIPEPQNK